MRKTAKILALLLVLAVLATAAFTGCGSQAEPKSSEQTKAAQTEATTAVPQEDKSPIVLTYFTSGQPDTYSKELMSDTKIGKMIQEETGVDVKFQYVVGDQDTAIGVMIASGDYPDMLFARSITSNKFVEAGALLPLEDLITQHAPDIKSAYEYASKRMKNKNDGHIYLIGKEAAIGDQAPLTSVSPGFGIQKQVLEELGWPNIKTVDQYFDAIKQYKDKNPKIEGKDSIGFLVLVADGWRNTIKWATDMAVGIPHDGKALIDPATGKATLRETSEHFKRYMSILNKAYNQGLVDKEGFVQNYDQYKVKIASGRVIATFDYDWEVGDSVSSLLKQGKEGRTYYYLPLTFDEATKLPPIPKVMPDSGEGIGITIKAKDKAERIMKFFNYLCKPETQKLLQWGIEGEDYYVENGRLLKTAEQIAKYNDPKYIAEQGLRVVGPHGWPSLSGVFPDGNAVLPTQQPEVVKMGFSEWDNKFMKAYNINTPGDLLNKEAPVLKYFPIWTMPLKEGSPEKIFETEVEALTIKWYPKLVMAKEGEFEKAWTEFVGLVEKLPLKEFINAIEAEVKYRNDNW